MSTDICNWLETGGCGFRKRPCAPLLRLPGSWVGPNGDDALSCVFFFQFFSGEPDRVRTLLEDVENVRRAKMYEGMGAAAQEVQQAVKVRANVAAACHVLYHESVPRIHSTPVLFLLLLLLALHTYNEYRT